jgi:hypothetical protein
MTPATTTLHVAAANDAPVDQAPDGPAEPSAAAPVAAFEIVDRHQPGAYGFSVRVGATGRLYRITPARDPQEPRFWCVIVYRCTLSGLPDGGERPWLGSAGLRRDELAGVMTAIRDDVAGWLAAMPSPALAQWFLAPPDPVAPTGSAGGPAPRRPPSRLDRDEPPERRSAAR